MVTDSQGFDPTNIWPKGAEGTPEHIHPTSTLQKVEKRGTYISNTNAHDSDRKSRNRQNYDG